MRIKNIGDLLCDLMLLSIFLFWCGNQSFGQEKINLSMGFGMPELLNVGVHYRLEQTQIRIGVGALPLKNESLISISGDIYYHFAGSSELSNRRPWYGRSGLNYSHDETKSNLDRYLHLYLRIGRDINISRKIGIEVDVGTSIRLFYNDTGFTIFGIDLPILPSFGISFLY